MKKIVTILWFYSKVDESKESQTTGEESGKSKDVPQTESVPSIRTG
jgi:hypothetical protein